MLAMTSSASSVVRVIGLSTNTCFLYFAAFNISSACVLVGVPMTTASIDSSSNTSSILFVQFGIPNSCAAFFAVSCLEVTIYLRSEEHTSELQSRGHLVCRLLLEKKKQ